MFSASPLARLIIAASLGGPSAAVCCLLCQKPLRLFVSRSSVYRLISSALDASKTALARRMHTSGESANTIAATHGVSRATVYRVLAEDAE